MLGKKKLEKKSAIFQEKRAENELKICVRREMTSSSEDMP